MSATTRCATCGAEAAERLHLADRIALRPREAAAALGIGEKALRRLLPRLRCVVRDGGVVMIIPDLLREDLHRLAADAAGYGGEKPSHDLASIDESDAHDADAEKFVQDLRAKAGAGRRSNQIGRIR